MLTGNAEYDVLRKKLDKEREEINTTLTKALKTAWVDPILEMKDKKEYTKAVSRLEAYNEIELVLKAGKNEKIFEDIH